MTQAPDFIRADWPAPDRIKAFTTTRVGGFSVGPFASCNIGDHVGDDPDVVQRNRALIYRALSLPSEPRWLTQVHGVTVVDAATAPPQPAADGAWTDRPGIVLAVMTADCLPVFLCDQQGTQVGLLHAGWRGLAAGVIEAGVETMTAGREQILAHLGPAIGPQSYEVGEDVRAAFLQRDPAWANSFRRHGTDKWLIDLYALARQRLRALGVTAVSGGAHCTLRERDRFYSYRRDGRTGRMASLIWID